MKLEVSGLRKIVQKEKNKKKTSFKQVKKATSPKHKTVLRTSLNTIDLRGMRVEESMTAAWKFIDSAVLNSEDYVIILHGHGTAAIKESIRQSLSEDKSYDLSYRPGFNEEGGDAVTVVYFKK